MILAILLTIGTMLFEAYVPIYLMVTMVVILGWFYFGLRVYIPLVVVGLWFDLTTARSLGVTSMVLILLATLLMLARKQFEWNSMLVVMLLGVVGELLVRLYLGDTIAWWQLLFQGLVVGTIWWGYTRLKGREGVYLK